MIPCVRQERGASATKSGRTGHAQPHGIRSTARRTPEVRGASRLARVSRAQSTGWVGPANRERKCWTCGRRSNGMSSTAGADRETHPGPAAAVRGTKEDRRRLCARAERHQSDSGRGTPQGADRGNSSTPAYGAGPGFHRTDLRPRSPERRHRCDMRTTSWPDSRDGRTRIGFSETWGNGAPSSGWNCTRKRRDWWSSDDLRQRIGGAGGNRRRSTFCRHDVLCEGGATFLSLATTRPWERLAFLPPARALRRRPNGSPAGDCDGSVEDPSPAGKRSGEPGRDALTGTSGSVAGRNGS